MTTAGDFFSHAGMVRALRNGGTRLRREIDAVAQHEMHHWHERQRGRRVDLDEQDRVWRQVRAMALEVVFKRETKPFLDVIVRIRCLAMPTRFGIPAGGGAPTFLDDGLWPAGRQGIADMHECIAAVAESLGLCEQPDSRQPTAAGPAVR